MQLIWAVEACSSSQPSFNFLISNHMMMIDATTTADAVFPMYHTVFAHPESDLTFSLPLSRKRKTRGDPNGNWNPNDSCTTYSYLREDISSLIQQQQFEMDRFVARHNEKVRREMEQKRRRNSMKLISAIEENVTHRLRAKEEEIANMRKINYALEDKVKSLCIENQIWRELAQTNEATANALRSNLKQVLEQVVHGGYRRYNMEAGEESAATMAVVDDVLSCCESNNENECMLAEQDTGNSNSNSNNNRLCKRCGEAESCVLLLPCRHLCLCRKVLVVRPVINSEEIHCLKAYYGFVRCISLYSC
ncbi:putative E3 ubiquitin-protein ligase BOI [Helianthus annuus]|nr:putative E3 ubiquitin-protein ligase BOI [Helianthus annuus]